MLTATVFLVLLATQSGTVTASPVSVESLATVSAASLIARYAENLAYLPPVTNRPNLAITLSDDRRQALLSGFRSTSTNSSTSTKAGMPISVNAVPIAFLHGVASGDPLANAVILWTKVTPDLSQPRKKSHGARVDWQVATDRAFTRVLLTTSEVDHTVKIDVKGLTPATTYYYRFISPNANGPVVSTVGVTKTMPAEDAELDVFKLAVVTCSNMAHGYFHSYARIAEDPSIDVTLHVGDYIYEYDLKSYKPTKGWNPPANRVPSGGKVITSLADYRARYTQYKTDRALQSMHAAKAMIAIWDDHEFADNATPFDAPDDKSGNWPARRDAAARAYHEHLPIRPNLVADNKWQIYRRFNIGKLVDLFMMDTRMDARDDRVPPKDRRLLGVEQEKWLFDGMKENRATWRVLGNQVMFAPKPTKVLWKELNLLGDDWNGALVSRQNLLDHMAHNKINDTLMITGDFHASLVSDIPNPAAKDKQASVFSEFIAPSVTSSTPAFDNWFLAKLLTPVLKIWNKNVHFSDFVEHGWINMQFTKTAARVDYMFVHDIHDIQGGEPQRAKTFEMARGANRVTKTF
ncbi:PhoD-like phosphatase-domain-containing protein [Blastocladiella britannica]|nr:PhoD-like phosphatase-domain-containing protein [Blastocladiella britannica]